MSVIDVHANLAVDHVSAYFGMRSIKVGRDKNGQPRLKLNRHVEMHIGMLDQGFWPDGLHTAPSGADLLPDSWHSLTFCEVDFISATIHDND